MIKNVKGMLYHALNSIYCLNYEELMRKEVKVIRKKLDEVNPEVSLAGVFAIIDKMINKKKSWKNDSVIITGSFRVGKTIISEKIAESLNLVIIKLDTIKRIYRKIEYDKQIYIKLKIYNEMIKRYPAGVLFEGDDIIIDRYRENYKGRHEVTLKMLVYMKKNYGINTFVIGNKNDDPSDKERGIRNYAMKNKCWTKKDECYEYYYKKDGLRKLAEDSIVISKKLHSEALAHDVDYYDIRQTKYHEDIAYAEESIKKVILKKKKV